MSTKSENENLNLQLEAYEPDAVFGKVQALRDEIVIAWQERAIMLNHYEQELLRLEILKACKLLSDLVGNR